MEDVGCAWIAGPPERTLVKVFAGNHGVQVRCLSLAETAGRESDYLHLLALISELTVFTQTQTDYAGVKVDGPFKGGDYLF